MRARLELARRGTGFAWVVTDESGQAVARGTHPDSWTQALSDALLWVVKLGAAEFGVEPSPRLWDIAAGAEAVQHELEADDG